MEMPLPATGAGCHRETALPPAASPISTEMPVLTLPETTWFRLCPGILWFVGEFEGELEGEFIE